MIVQEGGPRRNASSAEQSRGQKVQSPIKSNVSDSSIDENKYQEGTGQREAMKYLSESCYHRIEFSTTNFLVIVVFSLTTTLQRLQEGANVTRINTNNLIYTWRAKMKGGI